IKAAHARGTVAGADTDALLALLSQVPTSPGYRHRRAFPLELWWFSLLILGFNPAWRDFDDAWLARYALAAQLGLAPVRRYGARSVSRRLRLPLVRPAQLPAGETVGDVLQQLVNLALSRPAAFAAPERLELRRSLDSLLLRLALRSLQVALGDVGREVLGESAPQPEPLIRSESDPGQLERRIELLTDAMLVTGSPATFALRRTCDGLVRIGDVDEARLERLLRATLDCAIYRVDPWFVGPPTRRLQDLLNAGRTDHRLGAYGWVDAPRPGSPGPNAAGLIHAPSHAQGLTAAVLRDRAVNDPEPRWHLDLTSRSVRAADRVAEQVRVGAHLAEALGREIERIVGRRSVVEQLRDRFPLRTEHAGRRTCDGLAVLAEDPATLGLDATALAGLDDLRAGLDAYGDLLVAEAVHHVTQGRAESAGGVMDAAAGLSRPPQLDVLRTAREGRAVATTALLLVPAVAGPPLPAADIDRAELSPASLADTSAAAFVAAQVGAAATWRWEVAEAGAGGAGVTVRLNELDLLPADALALPQADLERLVLETGAATLGLDREAVELTASDGGRSYEAAARLVGLLGRAPAGPDAVAREPE
ncbi:MAG: hypothetical protein ACRDM0_26090, partial [Thermoleophilaceae bacterium]